ncbi:MAG: hypothetical protein H0Z33_07020 [Bacillaceae bacterium]|nr:hypothetical protein [Bacillaceae bacterium]
MISEGFSKLRDHLSLVLYPILFDLLAFVVGIAVSGFPGQSKMTFKFSLNVGLPSISHVLDQNVMANGFSISTDGSAVPMLLILLFIIFFIIGAYLQAGFIGLLHEAAKGRETSLDRFMRYAGQYWLTYLGINIIIFLFMIVVGGLLILTLSIAGVMIFLILFLVLRILYIYWEFTVITDEVGLAEAFTRSRAYFRNRTPDTVTVIVAIIGINFLFGLVVNALWNPFVLFLAILGYGYIATGMQLSLMLTLHQILGKGDALRI